jgi:hypothetical protein
MSSAAHSKAIWRDSALGALVGTPVPVYLVDDGSGNVVPSFTGPAAYAFVDVAGDGNVRLTRLAPLVLTDVSGSLELHTSGIAAAIMVDDGAGNLIATTTIRQTPTADFLADTGGDVWLVRRPWPQLTAVQVSGNIVFY